jgi:hypothetical protein
MFSKVNDAYQTVKNALEAEVALATADQKEILANAKLALAEIKDLMADLKEENRSLKEQLEVKGDVIFDDQGRAWIDGEPHCGGCLGSKGQKIRLSYLHGDTYRCPSCQFYFGNSNHTKKLAPQKTPND